MAGNGTQTGCGGSGGRCETKDDHLPTTPTHSLARCETVKEAICKLFEDESFDVFSRYMFN